MQIKLNYEKKINNKFITQRHMMLLIAAMTLFILGLTALNEANAYSQLVKINIDKTDYLLGKYGVILINYDTGVTTKNYYNDNTATPFVTVNGYIDAIEGDKLQACVMQMSSGLMACDYKYALNPYNYLDFDVDMRYATTH
ncbi:MAG TPA: hypothetical protein VK250_04320 [Nitrososphaeraceae archaeon]|nr:hypothetical protein [Nitrososphaeraceae archaeon]